MSVAGGPGNVCGVEEGRVPTAQQKPSLTQQAAQSVSSKPGMLK